MKTIISLFALLFCLHAEVLHAKRELVPSGLPNYKQINTWIHRGGRPTEQGLLELQKLGIKTIINLENNEEAVAYEKDQAAKRGIKFFSYPINPFATPNTELVDQVLTHLQDPNLYPIYLHCNHGRDRTGLLMGLFRVELQGWAAGDAYWEMVDMGFRTVLAQLDKYFKQRTGLIASPLHHPLPLSNHILRLEAL